jgi:DNA-binding NarL/FixJ family response regulator
METLQNGASGYLLKEENMNVIIAAVKGVARGETGWLSRRVSALIATWMGKEDPASLALTRRELDVLWLLVAGLTNRRIALELGISEKTVEKYLESIQHKLGVNSRVEAAVYAVRNNLLKNPAE